MSSSAQPTPETTLGRAVNSACAVVLYVFFYLLDQRGLFVWNGRWSHDPWLLTFGSVTLLTALLPWVPASSRKRALLVGSILIGAILLRWMVVLPLLLAWITPRVTRQGWPNWLKLALLLGAWAGVVALGWYTPHGLHLRHTAWAIYWGFLPAPLICLVVERSRGQLVGVSELDEQLYLLAFPRFFTPFLQPIGAARFIASAGTPRTPRLALRGLLLGLYCSLGFVALQHLHYSIKNPSDEFPLPQDPGLIAQNVLYVYAINATVIFSAVAQLRLLGYDLGSGFNFPLLSSSMAEFYRRWNYYFFEFASSIYYWPIANRLRRWVPLWLAHILAGYPSILLGVWVLDNVFTQFPQGQYGQAMFQQLADWRKLGGYAFVWSLIILPHAIFTSPLRKFRRLRWWNALGRVATFGLILSVLVLFFLRGVAVF